MKVISVVHTSFVNDNRVARIARAMGEFSDDITVLAWRKGKLPKQDNEENFKVERISVRSELIPRWNLVFGAIHFVEYIFRAAWRARKADLIICNDIEGFCIGLLAKFFKKRIKLIYDCHELESERMGKSKWNKKFVNAVERKYINRSSFAITVSPSIKEWYEMKYPYLNVILVRNIPYVQKVSKGNLFHDKFELDYSMRVFLYQGALMEGRGLELLIDAFENYVKDQRNVLVIMGSGKLQNEIERKAKLSNRIFFHEAVSMDELPNYTGSAYFGINSVEPKCLSYAYCLPNKFFETLLSGIPILTNDLVDCANLIEQYKVGKVFKKWTAEGLAEVVEEVSHEGIDCYKLGLQNFRNEISWDKEQENLSRAIKTYMQ